MKKNICHQKTQSSKRENVIPQNMENKSLRELIELKLLTKNKILSTI